LNHFKVGGRVLNYPNSGGYLRWRSSPAYQIFMNLEVPFLFPDEDFAMADRVFFTREGLAQGLRRFRPSFITVPFKLVDFRHRISEYSEYVPVFVDDAEVLYVNAQHHPTIASQYVLGCDPFDLAFNPHRVLSMANPQELLATLQQMLAIDGGSEVTQYAAGLLDLQVGATEEALRHAQAAIVCAPRQPRDHWLQADVLARQGARAEALAAYRAGLRDYQWKRRFHFRRDSIAAFEWWEDREVERIRRVVREKLEASEIGPPEKQGTVLIF